MASWKLLVVEGSDMVVVCFFQIFVFSVFRPTFRCFRLKFWFWSFLVAEGTPTKAP